MNLNDLLDAVRQAQSVQPQQELKEKREVKSGPICPICMMGKGHHEWGTIYRCLTCWNRFAYGSNEDLMPLM